MSWIGKWGWGKEKHPGGGSPRAGGLQGQPGAAEGVLRLQPEGMDGPGVGRGMAVAGELCLYLDVALHSTSFLLLHAPLHALQLSVPICCSLGYPAAAHPCCPAVTCACQWGASLLGSADWLSLLSVCFQKMFINEVIGALYI